MLSFCVARSALTVSGIEAETKGSVGGMEIAISDDASDEDDEMCFNFRPNDDLTSSTIP